MNEKEIREIVAQVLANCSGGRDCVPAPAGAIPVEASARHIHLTAEATEKLFGEGAQLVSKRALSQPGEFLSEQRVRIVTCKGEIANVAVLGPCRSTVQVELSLTDCRTLGIDAPINLSGDLEGAADVLLIGDKGIYEAKGSAIAARAHVHLNPDSAKAYGVTDGQQVNVRVEGRRTVTFEGIPVRVKSTFSPALHIDFDEANACALDKNSKAFIVGD